MIRISVGQAVSAGFRLIMREPVAFLAWCGGYFAVSAIPLVLSWSDMASFYAALGSAPNLTDPSIVALQQRMAVYQPISMLTGLIVMVCLPAAAMRAVL